LPPKPFEANYSKDNAEAKKYKPEMIIIIVEKKKNSGGENNISQSIEKSQM
jgi:hypothetical protein